MRRVSVIGTSGSGKTTLARNLAAVLDCPWLELDSVFHQFGWTPLEETEFQRRVTDAAGAECWVIDGGYSAVQPIIWARADTVIWLDLPKRVLMRRITWRTVHRAVTGRELWNGNRERWQNLFSWDRERSMIAWTWQTYGSGRKRYTAAMADPEHAHLRWVRLTSAAAVRRFLREAGSGGD